MRTLTSNAGNVNFDCFISFGKDDCGTEFIVASISKDVWSYHNHHRDHITWHPGEKFVGQ
jgi:hypothetical protein